MQLRPALSTIFLNLSGQTRELVQLRFFFFQLLLDFRDGVIGLLDLSGVFFGFFFPVADVALRARDQVGKFLRTLPIELNPAAVRRDFTFQSLHLRARIGDLDVELVQCVAFFS